MTNRTLHPGCSGGRSSAISRSMSPTAKMPLCAASYRHYSWPDDHGATSRRACVRVRPRLRAACLAVQSSGASPRRGACLQDQGVRLFPIIRRAFGFLGGLSGDEQGFQDVICWAQQPHGRFGHCGDKRGSSLFWRSRRAAPRSNQRQERFERHGSWSAESDIGPPVPRSTVTPADGCWRAAAVLGIIQQFGEADSEWRLGTSGNASRVPDFRHDIGREHAALRRRYQGICIGIWLPNGPT
jgi:hypothetical protein